MTDLVQPIAAPLHHGSRPLALKPSTTTTTTTTLTPSTCTCASFAAALDPRLRDAARRERRTARTALPALPAQVALAVSAGVSIRVAIAVSVVTLAFLCRLQEPLVEGLDADVCLCMVALMGWWGSWGW